VSQGTLTGTQPAAIAHYAALREAYLTATAAVQEARANGSVIEGDSRSKRKSLGGGGGGPSRHRDIKVHLNSSPLHESALNGASNGATLATPISVVDKSAGPHALRTKRRRPSALEGESVTAAAKAADVAADGAAPSKGRKRGRPSTLELAQRELERQAVAAQQQPMQTDDTVVPPLQATPIASIFGTVVATRRPPPARPRRLVAPPADDVFVDTTVPHDDDESIDEFGDDSDEGVLGDGLIISQNLFEFGGSVQPATSALASAAAVGHHADDSSDDNDNNNNNNNNNNNKNKNNAATNKIADNDDDDDDDVLGSSRRRVVRRSAFRDAASAAVIDNFLMSPLRHPLVRSPHKPSPAPGSAVVAASAAATAAVNGGMSGEIDDMEMLFNTGPSWSELRNHSVIARMRALTPISSPSLLSPSAVKLSVPHTRGVSKHVVRRLLSPKRDTPLARALATEAEAAAAVANGGSATPRRLHSMPSTPRRVTVVSNAPPTAPSPRRSNMLANNKAYLTRLSVASGSSLAERFGVDMSPMSPTRASPRRPHSARTRELHVRTPTAGGSLVIGGSLGEVVVRPRNLSASFHAPQNLFAGKSAAVHE
jgi:hypothetical protein